MRVRNNMANPYMLCGEIIPPGGVADVNDFEFEKMKQVVAFKKVLDSKGIEVVGVQAVSPGLNETKLPPASSNTPPSNPNAENTGKKEPTK